jgi:hypothetical protein
MVTAIVPPGVKPEIIFMADPPPPAPDPADPKPAAPLPPPPPTTVTFTLVMPVGTVNVREPLLFQTRGVPDELDAAVYVPTEIFEKPDATAAGAVLCQVVPLLVSKFPVVPGATT